MEEICREKIVAIVSSRMIIVADDRKMVQQLGSHSVVPIEIVPFGRKTTAKRLGQVGAQATLRMVSGQIFLMDGDHYILDYAQGPIPFPTLLQDELDGIVGVVEHGLFIGIACQAHVGGHEGVRIFDQEALKQ